MSGVLHLLQSQSRMRQLLLAGGAATAVYAAYAVTSKPSAQDLEVNKRLEEMAKEKSNATKKVTVDKEFLRRLRYLLSIVLPGVRTKEFFILGLHTFFLVSRTLVSIYVARLDGSIVKSIVDRKLKLFIWLMCKWMLVAVPATYINSMIMYLESKLAIAFRTRLVKHVYQLYMQGDTYYRVGNLDSRLSNPDQCLTEDVNVFCTDLAHLYSHLSKPCLDVVLMTAQLIWLSQQRGGGNGHSGRPLILASTVIIGTGYVLKKCTPPFGKLIAEQARRYGELRAAHSRVIVHSEEIAFYGGHVVERNVLQQTYDDLVKHINYIYRKRIWYTMLEQFLMRYVWGACGLLMIAYPQFSRYHESLTASLASSTAAVGSDAETANLPKDTDTDNVSTRTQDFVTSRGLLISAADAIERMMSSWKEITELAGRTARIYEMLNIFEQVQKGEYVKIQTNAAANGATITEIKEGEEEEDAEDEKNGKVCQKNAKNDDKKKVKANGNGMNGHSNGLVPVPTTPRAPGIVHDNSPYIELDRVPVVTPNGDMLVDEPGLSFIIRPGMHLLITGPNGCGKSSLFRMLGGLWPVRDGLLRKPAKRDMFYVPQRPYLTRGSFREQFIYPDTDEDFTTKGLKDEDLNRILEIVALKHVVAREGGLDARNDWRDVLSGGEKQRVGMARVLYFKPRFAILDECTSAVSIDVEGQMYNALIDAGITMMTVAHRPSLFKYHKYLLQFDGQGGYKFTELNAEARLSLADEKAALENQLAGVPKAQKRLKELCNLLGESSVHLSKQ